MIGSILFLAIGMSKWFTNDFNTPDATTALWFYLFGVVLMLAAIVVIMRSERPDRASRPRRDWRGWLQIGIDVALLAGVVGIAIYFRFKDLGTLPYGVWYDEGDQALEAIWILAGHAYSPVGQHFHYNPTLFNDFVALAFKIGGVGDIVIRDVTAFFGVIAVPAVYLLARKCFGRWVGLFAALLLAVGRWPVDFSRFGLQNISTLVFMGLSMWLLARALQSGHWSDYMWGGLVFGLGFHTYIPYRLFMVVAPVIVVWRFAWDWRALNRQHIVGLFLFSLLTVAAVGPLIPYAVRDWSSFNERVDATSIFNPSSCADQSASGIRACLISNTQKHLLMFNYEGDGNGRHNLPNAPMLDPLTGAMLVLGLGIALSRIRNWRYLMLIAWFCMILVGGIFSVTFEAPQGARTLPITPALAMLAALPLGLLVQRVDELADIIKRVRWSKKVLRPLAYGLSWLAPLAMLLYVTPPVVSANYDSYFIKQAHDYGSWRGYDADATEVAKAIVAHGNQWDYYVDHRDYGRTPTFDFVVGPKLEQNITAYDPQSVLPIASWGPKGAILFISVDDGQALYAQAQADYPNAQYVNLGPSFAPDQPVEYEVVISADQAQAIHGLQASYWPGAPTGNPQTGHVAGLGNLSLSPPPLPVPFSARWSGCLFVSQSGQYQLQLQGGGTLTAWVDGQQVAQSGGGPGAAQTLAVGNHSLVVTGRVTGTGPIQLMWAQGQGSQMTPIPDEDFFAPPITAAGLLGTYYPDTAWTGAPALLRIDPTVHEYFDVPPNGVPDHFSVDWTGVISAPVSGSYQFQIESVDGATLFIDGKQVLDSSSSPNTPVPGAVQLTAGWHDIKVHYQAVTNYIHCYLTWQPPGQAMGPVPQTSLLPYASMENTP